jgi:putative pyruvate formate lyase activating enzyme
MPSYIELFKSGKLEKIRDSLNGYLKECTLCPRNCKVNRKKEIGFCRTKDKAIVSSFFLHFGEEPEIVGRGGSGTIFFSYCNLGCIYCQNYTISHLGEGKEVTPHMLAEIMLTLQREGAENINFVTPTHVIAQILEALCIAVKNGLNIPLVYNCGGYEKLETLKLIEGVFDIYMPDIKYSDNKIAHKFSSALNYWDIAKEAIKEMHRQVGDLVIEDGTVKKGLLIRHLVLPNHLAGSFKILDFVKEKISPHTYINIMDQYHPCYKANNFLELSRRITLEEYKEVIDYAKKIGLYRGFYMF